MGDVTAESTVPLARLMGMAFRLMVDDLHLELRRRGWTDVRESYGFVLLALREGGSTTTELAALLGVSKQATSKVLDAMEQSGFVRRHADGADARRKVVGLDRRGRELLVVVEEIYGQLEAGWAEVIGDGGLEGVRVGIEEVLRERHGGVLPTLRPG